jgi:hypothetical protein
LFLNLALEYAIWNMPANEGDCYWKGHLSYANNMNLLGANIKY